MVGDRAARAAARVDRGCAVWGRSAYGSWAEVGRGCGGTGMIFARQWQQLGIAANWPVLAAVAFLSAVGVVTLHADRVRGGSDEAAKQLVYMVVGVGCMAAFQAANYQKLGRVAWPLYFLSLGLVLYTAI